jgi:hypothetical protein
MKGDGLTSRHVSGPVEPDASKGARPVREGLLGVTLVFEINPQILPHGFTLPCGRGATGKDLAHIGEAVTDEAGEHAALGRVQILSVGFGPKLAMSYRG